MDFNALVQYGSSFLESMEENYVSAGDALSPELAGMRIYDIPLFACAGADDALFSQLKLPHVVGEGAFLPCDWLSGAKTVISFFLPFSEAVRKSNRLDPANASNQWLHGRIEGQIALDELGKELVRFLNQNGFDCVYPALDPRFAMFAPLRSNWSERHIAYVCGLGTFGLSKSLITVKGTAGRFGSIVTTAEFPPTGREYSSPFEYCTMCGVCAKNCPASAIDASLGVIEGKRHEICAPFVNATRRPPAGENARSRYGCGKCQTAVPCEFVKPK